MGHKGCDGHENGECGCPCLLCGSERDKAAAYILQGIERIEQLGCPPDVLVPALALALNVLALVTQKRSEAAHEALNSVLPRAAEYAAMLRQQRRDEAREKRGRDVN